MKAQEIVNEAQKSIDRRKQFRKMFYPHKYHELIKREYERSVGGQIGFKTALELLQEEKSNNRGNDTNKLNKDMSAQEIVEVA